MSNKITWGVDGFGRRSYLCSHCELEFGAEPDETHICDESKRSYSARDTRSKNYVHLAPVADKI